MFSPGEFLNLCNIYLGRLKAKHVFTLSLSLHRDDANRIHKISLRWTFRSVTATNRATRFKLFLPFMLDTDDDDSAAKRSLTIHCPFFAKLLILYQQQQQSTAKDFESKNLYCPLIIGEYILYSIE